MAKNKQITVLKETVRVQRIEKDDFISLTDIAKHKNPDAPADIVKNWLRSKNTLELLGLWEKLHNPEFKLVEFDQFRLENLNAHFIGQDLPQAERLKLLNNTAIQQMRLLTEDKSVKKLEGEK